MAEAEDFSPVFLSARPWAAPPRCCCRSKRLAIVLADKARDAGNFAKDATDDLRGKVGDVTSQWQSNVSELYERGRQVVESARANIDAAVAEGTGRSGRNARRAHAESRGIILDIKVNVREAPGDCYVVDLSGEIDVYTSPKVKDAIGSLIDRGVYHLVINLEKVRYIDSTGLGVLIGGLKRVREHGGSVNLVCTNPQIKKIFDITGLVKIFGIFDSEDAAMKALV